MITTFQQYITDKPTETDEAFQNRKSRTPAVGAHHYTEVSRYACREPEMWLMKYVALFFFVT